MGKWIFLVTLFSFLRWCLLFSLYCLSGSLQWKSAIQRICYVPYKEWKNALGEKRGRLALHSNSERHLKALDKSSILLFVSDQTQPSIVQSTSKAYSDKVEKNRASLLSLIDVIITLCKRNIAFRGNWNKEASEEDGNCMFFVNWKSSFDLVLKEHIDWYILQSWKLKRPPIQLRPHHFWTCTSNLTTMVNSVLKFMINGTTSILKS